MRKAFLKRSLAFVLLLAVMLCAGAAVAEAKTVELTVMNLTGKDVYIAFAREGAKDSMTKGWWKIESWETKTIKPFNYSSDDYYFYYAFYSSKSGKAVWKGNDFTGWIHPKDAFKSQNGRKVPGGQQVGFRHVKVPKSGKTTIKLRTK